MAPTTTRASSSHALNVRLFLIRIAIRPIAIPHAAAASSASGTGRNSDRPSVWMATVNDTDRQNGRSHCFLPLPSEVSVLFVVRRSRAGVSGGSPGVIARC